LVCLAMGIVVLACWLFVRPTAVSDAWHRAPPVGLFDPTNAQSVLFSEVKDSYVEHAVELLEDSPIVEITSADASAMTGRDAGALHRPFLVRALAGERKTGRFYADICDGALLIEHCALGWGVGRVQRWPLVVALKEPPREVYVSVKVIK
jgi:hypothetical protein